MHVSTFKTLKARVILYACLSMVLVGASIFVIRANNQKTVMLIAAQQIDEAAFQSAFAKYQALTIKITEYMAKGVNVTEPLQRKELVKQHFASEAYGEAEAIILSADTLLETLLAQKEEADRQKAAEEERQKGTIAGKVTGEGTSLLASATVTLAGDGGIEAAKAETTASGEYSLTLKNGAYTVTVSLSGYNTYQKAVEVKAQETLTHNVALTRYVAPTPTPKPTAAPTAAPTTSTDSNAYSSYERKTVATARGSFTVDVMIIDLGSGKVRVVTDTASDNDCADSCPTKSLSSFVAQNGGFAGMNGTYFCPTDYADCAGKTNTFHWKIYNTRLGKIINEFNGLGEDDPAFVFTADNKPRYFARWRDFVASGLSITAGMNSKPALVQNGSIVLDDSLLDSKQRTTRSSRGALAQKGDHFYNIRASGATVTDLAYIAQALGVDHAMNIDGGGSSAMFYKGSYKVGPGRALPNAIIFDD